MNILQSDRHLWPLDYIGRPFRSGASGPACFDCWGLVRHYYQTVRKVHLPVADCHDFGLKEVRRGFARPELYRGFGRVDKPADGDCVLMKQGRWPSHVGLWSDLDGGRVIHALPQTGVVAQPLYEIARAGYEVAGYYRYGSAGDCGKSV